MSAGRLRAALVAIGWCALASGPGCTVLDGDLFPEVPDAGVDAGRDAATDAGPDAATDAGPDAAADGSVDGP